MEDLEEDLDPVTEPIVDLPVIDTPTPNNERRYSYAVLLALRDSPLSQGIPEGLQIPQALRTDILHGEEDFSDSDSDDDAGIDFFDNNYDPRAGG